MLVDFEYREDVVVLRLRGRFDTGRDTGYLRSKADELKESGYTKVLADMNHVEYVDSTGIGFLIALYTGVLRSPNGRFALANLHRRVREVLELTRLSEILPIFPDEESALAALKADQKLSASQTS